MVSWLRDPYLCAGDRTGNANRHLHPKNRAPVKRLREDSANRWSGCCAKDRGSDPQVTLLLAFCIARIQQVKGGKYAGGSTERLQAAEDEQRGQRIRHRTANRCNREDCKT